MNIELSSGKKIDGVTVDDLKEKLQLLKSGEDFLILEDDDGYIQCAVSGRSLLFEYQDSSGHFSSNSAVSFDEAEEMLTLYLNRDSSWKGIATWEADNGYDGAGGSVRPGQAEESFSVGGILNTIKKTAKKEVKRSIERKTSGIVRAVFRKFTK